MYCDAIVSISVAIIDRSEQATVRSTYKLCNLQEKLARYRNHVTFFIRCRNSDVVPKGLRIITTINSTRARNIADRASRAILRERMNFARRMKVTVSRDIAMAERELWLLTDEGRFEQIKTWADARADKVFQDTKEKHKKKFDYLTKTRSSPTKHVTSLDNTKVIVNLSGRELDEAEKDVLSLGLNFAVAPNKVPERDIIAGMEALARQLDTQTGMKLRRIVKDCLEKAGPPSPNLTRQQQQAVSTVVILPADKGNATVVMDTSAYQSKIDDILSDDNYRQIRKDPTKKLERELSERLKHLEFIGKLPPGLRKRLNPSHSYIPQLYGLPKVHKDGIPLRPIVSTIGSVNYNLAKEMTRILNPLTGTTPSHILNSTHFVQLSHKVKLDDKDLMVSFDVCGLFTKVPIDEAMLIMAKKKTRAWVTELHSNHPQSAN